MLQRSFDFLADDAVWWSGRLNDRFGKAADLPRFDPLRQLIRSLLGSRTRDAVSLDAFHRLLERWPQPAKLADATPAAVERVIANVTFAEKKAVYLPAALQMIGAEKKDYSLDSLARLSVPDALAWLERLPGVGRKVAAATLNASTLRMPAFIVDSHVHRVLQRLGVIGETTAPRTASELVTAGGGLEADGLLNLFGGMKRLGQRICRFEMPDCAQCPLAQRCRLARRRDADPLVRRLSTSGSRRWSGLSSFRAGR